MEGVDKSSKYPLEEAIKSLTKLQPLENLLERRAYVKTEYDTIQHILYHFFEVTGQVIQKPKEDNKKDPIIGLSLEKRWDQIIISCRLLKIESGSLRQFDGEIAAFQKARFEIDHSENYDPAAKLLLRVDKFREKAENIIETLDKIIDTYLKEVKTSIAGSDVYEMAAILLREARYISNDSLPLNENEETQQINGFSIQDFTQRLKLVDDNLNILISSKKIENKSLIGLVNLAGLFYYVYGRRDAFLALEICPKCGAKIKKTQTSGGGTEDDPSPTYANMRIGCSKCDYEIVNERIDL